MSRNFGVTPCVIAGFKNAKGEAEKEVRKFKKNGLELKFL